MYQIIYDFLLSLFPLTITSGQLALVELMTLGTLVWLYVIALKFIVSITKWFGGLLWFR